MYKRIIEQLEVVSPLAPSQNFANSSPLTHSSKFMPAGSGIFFYVILLISLEQMGEGDVVEGKWIGSAICKTQKTEGKNK